MTLFRFTSDRTAAHRALLRNGEADVDGERIALRALGNDAFSGVIDGRSERLIAVAHGDSVHVHLRGRAHRLERVDPTRSQAAAAGGVAGESHAPMPGVVVSVHAEVGQPVKEGDALLVIESMKLQMTIAAAAHGIVAELPLGVGQTFQRGAVLARLHAEVAT